jgi:hypothetical protein
MSFAISVRPVLRERRDISGLLYRHSQTPVRQTRQDFGD